MRYRILISDDEVDIVEMLTGFFRSKGYEVFSAYNGVETLKLAELQPDIILLDINMPKLDGIEVCKKIRDYVSCPILFLTARIEENDKVQGFSVGGDDYIVKPFAIEELLARVRALLRRISIEDGNNKEHQTTVNYKDLTIEKENRVVRRGDEVINLTKREYELLLILMENINVVMSRKDLLSKVWGYESKVETNVVDVYIRYLRNKIDRPGEKSYIQTVRGTGYVIRS